MTDHLQRDEAASSAKVIPVVLCGGSGTRLWPLSRRELPKQHVPILDGTSLFQRTLERLAGKPFARPIVIAGAAARFMVADQAAATGVPIDLVLEPEGRDTLAAVTLAALVARRRDPDAVVLVMPSDHLIPDIGTFEAAVTAAATAASDGDLVVFGIQPTEPSTAYGYIMPGEPLAGDAYRVRRFVEKPDAERARDLIGDGCLWNAGMFCFAVDDALREIEAAAPEAIAPVARALEEAIDDDGCLLVGAMFGETPKISFDHGVMEHTARAAVLAADFAWSDVGDWRETWRLAPKNDDGVAQAGPVVVRDTTNSYVRAEDRLVCVVGVDGLAVVDTADALLVAPLARAQEIKGLVGQLDGAGRAEAVTPARVHRPWGWYQTMDLGDRFRVKRIHVIPGKKLSLQRHHHRAEHWVVVRGTAEVTRDDETVLLSENQSIYLPLGAVHRLANPGKIPVEIVEVQTGAYLEEDDIIRIDDDFGRT